MMSLHSATHSSQMNTRGPEISLRTSRRRFPQNEQWKSSIKEEYCTRSPCRQAPSRLFEPGPSASNRNPLRDDAVVLLTREPRRGRLSAKHDLDIAGWK